MTLAEKVSKDFSRIKVKKLSVKVPSLKHRARPKHSSTQKAEIPIASIVSILIKNAVEKAKSEKKEKPVDFKSYLIKEDKFPAVNGGYGASSKGYGSSAKTAYVDYGKLFSYLGRFRARNAYQSGEEEFVEKPVQLDDNGFFLADQKLMDQGAKYIRYFSSKTPIDKTSLVPMAGMNSGEWEQFKLWMRLDPVMYLLKISTS